MAGFGKASVSTAIGQPATKGEMECGEVGNEQTRASANYVLRNVMSRHRENRVMRFSPLHGRRGMAD